MLEEFAAEQKRDADTWQETFHKIQKTFRRAVKKAVSGRQLVQKKDAEKYFISGRYSCFASMDGDDLF